LSLAATINGRASDDQAATSATIRNRLRAERIATILSALSAAAIHSDRRRRLTQIDAPYRTISELTSRRRLLVDTQLQVAELNRVLTGWSNYFCLGLVSKAYRAIDTHVMERLRRWLCKKHKIAKSR
jgi:hypothetical protein